MESDLKCLVLYVAPIMEKHLERLKIDFKTEIDSNRSLERICTFEELIAVLLKRDFINDDDRTTWKKLNPILQKYEDVSFYRNQDSCLNSSHGNVISYLSKRISYSWRFFARNLGLMQIHIDDIEQECGKNYSKCVIQVLHTYEKNRGWMSKTGSTFGDIHRALKLLNSGDEVEYLVNGFVRLTGFNQN
ncbi:Transcription-associated protein 1 [Frankliniella fusca]|uniref:Transcription-associated protein 1 n=1 Tax=Frankliniella fusca TaxID=407009 RepID=A0AAE1I245_9NEOP|nr:Transcription-associated protein 1 [Frankliniella fusca]